MPLEKCYSCGETVYRWNQTYYKLCNVCLPFVDHLYAHLYATCFGYPYMETKLSHMELEPNGEFITVTTLSRLVDMNKILENLEHETKRFTKEIYGDYYDICVDTLSKYKISSYVDNAYSGCVYQIPIRRRIKTSLRDQSARVCARMGQITGLDGDSIDHVLQYDIIMAIRFLFFWI
ncbi:coiled coils domain protein [Faustovirus]|nr:coiled coils domain protein [Faustovirus]